MEQERRNEMAKSKLQGALLGRALTEAYKLPKGQKFVVSSLFPSKEWLSFDRGIPGQLGNQFRVYIDNNDLSIKKIIGTRKPVKYEKR
jgi:hypothetical protein